MQKAFVLSNTKKPLMPGHSARARQLLKQGKATVYRAYPFTLILKERDDGITQPIKFKVDPGSKTTGFALVSEGKTERKLVFAMNLEHRGQAIKNSLESRRALRRSRCNRKMRYRAPRFLNRRRPKGWLAPSLQSRVDNIASWHKKLVLFTPITSNVVETARFDMQKIQTVGIAGKAYQQGTLFGYEIREYLLEKFNRTCAYCGKKNIPLQIEHIQPKSKGCSNRVSNLTLACEPCNLAKGNRLIEDFVRNPSKLKKILAQVKTPLKDAAAVNSTRYAIGNRLKKTGLATPFWSGGRTKHNRTSQNYPKDHWVDAACVGETREKVSIVSNFKALQVTATGRGTRQMGRVDKFGFPRTAAKTRKRVFGFQTGDQVVAVIPKGKKIGSYSGRVAVRKTGNFNIKTQQGTIQGLNYKYFRRIHQADGYDYTKSRRFPPTLAKEN